MNLLLIVDVNKYEFCAPPPLYAPCVDIDCELVLITEEPCRRTTTAGPLDMITIPCTQQQGMKYGTYQAGKFSPTDLTVTMRHCGRFKLSARVVEKVLK